jgi:hypothetical protein
LDPSDSPEEDPSTFLEPAALKLLATTAIVWGAAHLLALFFKP